MCTSFFSTGVGKNSKATSFRQAFFFCDVVEDSFKNIRRLRSTSLNLMALTPTDGKYTIIHSIETLISDLNFMCFLDICRSNNHNILYYLIW